MSNFIDTKINVKASSVETASHTTQTLSGDGFTSGIFGILITAASGTAPTLDVNVQGSGDGVTWFNLGGGYAFAQKTTTGSDSLVLGSATPIPKFFRLNAQIAGTTPSFTYSVVGFFKK